VIDPKTQLSRRENRLGAEMLRRNKKAAGREQRHRSTFNCANSKSRTLGTAWHLALVALKNKCE
jgi:hypothetical protein